MRPAAVLPMAIPPRHAAGVYIGTGPALSRYDQCHECSTTLLSDNFLTFGRIIQWIENSKTSGLTTSCIARRKVRRQREPPVSCSTSTLYDDESAPLVLDPPRDWGVSDGTWLSPESGNPDEQVPSPVPSAGSLLDASASRIYTVSSESGAESLSSLDEKWLQSIYTNGFEAVFGSWMGKSSCPFM